MNSVRNDEKINLKIQKNIPVGIVIFIITVFIAAVLALPVFATEDTTPAIPIDNLKITKIEMGKTPTKSVYRTGESLNVAGATIKIYYSDNSTKTVPVNSNWCIGFDSSSAGTCTVTVSHPMGGNSVTFKVTIAALKGIKISAVPKKTEYYVGEAEDRAGLVVTQIFTDGSTDTLPDGYTVSGFETATAGNKRITVSFGGFSATYQISVKERTVSKITVKNAPTRTEYFMGDELDPTGLLVTASYDDGSESDVTDYVTLVGFDTSEMGVRTVTVVYLSGSTNFNDAFTITVKIASALGIEITTPAAKTEYLAGEEFDPTGIVVSVVFEDGKREPVTEGLEFSGFVSNSLGNKTVTIAYGGFETTYKVNISVSPDHVHTEGEFITILESTCTTEGSEGTFCTVCGEPVNVRPLPLAEHLYGEWERSIEPTETEDGQDKRQCLVCGAEDVRILPKLGQILEYHGAVAVVSGDYLYPAGTVFTTRDIFGTLGGSELISMNAAAAEKLNAEVFSVIETGFTDSTGSVTIIPPTPVKYSIPLVGSEPYSEVYVMSDGETVESIVENGMIVFSSDYPGKFAIVGVLAEPRPVTTSVDDESSSPEDESGTDPENSGVDDTSSDNTSPSDTSGGGEGPGISRTLGTVIIIIVAVAIVGVILTVVYLYIIKKYY